MVAASMHGRGIFSSSSTCTVLSSMMREPRRPGERDVLRELRVRPGRRADRRLRPMAVHVDGKIEVGARPPDLAQRQIEQRLLARRLDERALQQLGEGNRAQLGHSGSLTEPPRRGTVSSMSDDGSDELPKKFEREWPEFLDEIRVALPGVQLLFGFLLAAPFSSHFDQVTGAIQNVFLVCFLATAASCIFLIAPSVYHRLHWRRDVRDKEQMLRTCNRLAIIGGVLLAVAMTSAVYVVTSIISTPPRALAVSGGSAGLILTLWFALPLRRRAARSTS